MTREQKKIELIKQVNKAKKLAAYIRNNPPKTTAHRLKLNTTLFWMLVDLHKIKSTPIITDKWREGGIHYKKMEGKTEMVLNKN